MPIRWISSYKGTRKPGIVRDKSTSYQILHIITLPAFLDQWLKSGKGLFAHKYGMIPWFDYFVETSCSGIDGGIKMRPSLDDLQMLGPEFGSIWQKFFVPAPDKPVLVLLIVAR